MPALLATGYEGKDQVVDRIPKRFKELKFGIQYVRLFAIWGLLTDSILYRSNQDIVNQGVLEITDRILYDVEKARMPVANGALDPRLVEISCGNRQIVPLADS